MSAPQGQSPVQSNVRKVRQFQNSLSAANTPQALSPPAGYPSVAYDFIIIYNNNTSDSIYVGDSSSQKIVIQPSGSMSIDIRAPDAVDITSIYWTAPTAGDTIVVMYA